MLGGIGIQKNHAFFSIDKNGNILLCPFSEQAKEGIRVNGIQIKGPTKVNNNDRIVFGTSNAFLFKAKGDDDNEGSDHIDFDFIANEIMEKEEKDKDEILKAKAEDEKIQEAQLKEEYIKQQKQAEL